MNPMGGCATCGEQSIPETELKVPNVSKFLKDDMFVIYSMNGCPYCEKVKELMRLTKQQFVVYTLDQHFTIENFENEIGTRTFPQVVVDNKNLGGCIDAVKYLREQKII